MTSLQSATRHHYITSSLHMRTSKHRALSAHTHTHIHTNYWYSATKAAQTDNLKATCCCWQWIALHSRRTFRAAVMERTWAEKTANTKSPERREERCYNSNVVNDNEFNHTAADNSRPCELCSLHNKEQWAVRPEPMLHAKR